MAISLSHRTTHQANDLNEVKKLGKPSDIIKLVFDLVGLLKMEKMVKTEPAEVTMGIGKEKADLRLHQGQLQEHAGRHARRLVVPQKYFLLQ